MVHASGTPARRPARRLAVLAAGFAVLLAGCLTDKVFAPRTGVINVRVSGAPPDPGIMVTVYIRDHIPPHNEARARLGIGDSTSFTGLGQGGFRIDVGIEDLDTHDCRVVAATAVVRFAGAEVVTVETNPNHPPEVTFELSCRSATLELETAGLPAADSALVVLARGDSAAAFDPYVPRDTIRVGNGVRSLPIVPPPTLWVIPDPVSGSDGRTYATRAQAVSPPSRQTTRVSVLYSPLTSCPADRPIAWYRLDGDASDASGSGYHGALQGPVAVPDRNGAAGAALSFDGTDDLIDLGDRFDSLELPYSVAAWLYIPASAYGEFRSIFASDDAPGHYSGIWLMMGPSGRLSMTYASGGPVGPATRRTVESIAPLPADRWIHVVATVRGPQDMTLYVEGIAVSSAYEGTGGPIAHTAGAPARIGSFRLVPANRPWLGWLDDVRVYDCSLEDGEVRFLLAQR